MGSDCFGRRSLTSPAIVQIKFIDRSSFNSIVRDPEPVSCHSVSTPCPGFSRADEGSLRW